jgi:universal stress protein E
VKALKHALVIMDKPKHEQIAFNRAQQLAKALADAGESAPELQLKAFVYNEAVTDAALDVRDQTALKRSLTRTRKTWLEEQVAAAQAKGLSAKGDAVWTEALARWTCEAVESNAIDLVVKTVHKSKTLTHTPADWTLLRQCQAPLLLCTRKRWSKAPKVLVALDLKRKDRNHARLNKKAIEAGCKIAALFGGEVHLVYTITVSSVLSDLDIVDARKLQKAAATQAQEAMEALAKPYGIPKSQMHLPLGKVGQGVNNVAGKIKADLLVMGTTGKTGLKGLVLGNSAEKVLTRAQCDILALKP